MSFICEKYDSTYIKQGQLMTKKLVPGLNFWITAIPLSIPVILSVIVNVHFLFLTVIVAVALMFVFMFIDLGTKHKYKHSDWRPFNRKRTEQKFFSYAMLKGENAGENYREKLIDYLDELRAGRPTDVNVENYLNRLHKAERLKIEALDELKCKNSNLSHLIDESLIEQIKIEKEAAQELL